MQEVMPVSSVSQRALAVIPQVLPESVVAEIGAKQKTRKIQNERMRDIILHVLSVCKEESVINALIIPLRSVCARVAMYIGVNERTINNIKKADRVRKAVGEGNRPLLNLKRPRDFKTILDDRDIIRIKHIVRDFYIKYRKVPAVHTLLPAVLDQIPTYKSSRTFLHKVFRNIGYKRKKYYSKRTVLIEDASIMSYRNDYFKSMKELRRNTKNIFYVYECVIDRSFTLHKSWMQKYGYNGALRDKNTFSFICAGSVNGFLKNSLLIMKNECDRNISRHPNQLSAYTFEKWLQKHLIPYLPHNSIVVMDDGPHHCREEDIPITYYDTKLNMCEYLRNKNVECDENMRRSELYKLIESNRPKHKVYFVDNLLQQHGHKVMRLPPYMVDLNPVQYAMDRVQQTLFEKEFVCNFNLQSVSDVLGQIMTSVTKEDWKTFFENVAAVEEECWVKDGEFEVAIDEVILNLRDCVDSGNEESDCDSDVAELKM